MKLIRITLVLCACVCLATADVAHLKAAKARLVSKLAGKTHHKRGVLSSVPTFKLGHDIPLVTHSVVKPLVVTYPPTATVSAVKIPLAHPLVHRYPVQVGHKVPVPHPHFGLKFPHHTKTVVVPKPDHHFHHHHHHVAPKPVIPIVPAAPAPVAPVVPVAQPTFNVGRPVPAPSPPVVLQPAHVPLPVPAPAPLIPAAPVASPPLHIIPQEHVHLKSVLPAPAIPIQPAPVVSPPLFPIAQQFPYVLRPGNAVQTSFFATYPRYSPLFNYHNHLFPLSAPAAPAPAPVLPALPAPTDGVVLEQPQAPHFHFIDQAAGHGHGHVGVLEQPTPTLAVEPTPTLLHPTQAAIPQTTVHLQPTQPAVPLEHDGWSPVSAQPHDIVPTHHPETHFVQPHEVHHQFTQEQGTQVYEHHTGATTDDQQYHDYQNQIQHHIQQQIEQAQFEQNLHNQLHHQQHVNPEYGVPQQIGQEYGQPNHDFSQHDFQQQGQDFAQHGQDFAQNGQDFSQHGQDFAQHGQDFAQNGHDFSQQGQDFNIGQQQPAQEYGVPQQGFEGRSSEGDGDTLQYHNHIPLGLQPPIDRPLEHFR